MKILHVISSGGMYGAEAVILNLMRALRSGPHASALCAFRNVPQPHLELYEHALAEGLDVHMLDCRGQFDPTLLSALRELVKRTQATIVHAHGYKADVYAYLAFRSEPVTLVSTCHTWYDNNLALRIYGMLDRFVLRNYARVASVSAEVQKRLLTAGVHSDRVECIRNGIDVRAFEARSYEAPIDRPLCIGLVGRLAWEKGVDIFLRAAAHVLGTLPLARFVVVGDGPDRAQLQALIEELDISSHARLLGRCEDMPSFYRSLDLLVSSSRQEGLPVAILEGMATGLPVVATSVGAVPSVVIDGKTGVLVVPENVEALTEAILALAGDPGCRVRLGLAARSMVAQEFSADRMAAAYLQFYNRAIERGGWAA